MACYPSGILISWVRSKARGGTVVTRVPFVNGFYICRTVSTYELYIYSIYSSLALTGYVSHRDFVLDLYIGRTRETFAADLIIFCGKRKKIK